MFNLGIFGGWAVACLLYIVVQDNILEVTATAEICHAAHNDVGDEGSCMDCAQWRNCYPGESCDVHCRECDHCYGSPDSDGCDVEPCMYCQGCAACPFLPQSCVDNCTVCQPYQDMLDCQMGPCKDCGPCFKDLTLPGCDFCKGCTMCENCSIMPSCHDCRCCQDVGCSVCEGEPAPCPDFSNKATNGYTTEELSNSWDDAPGIPYDIPKEDVDEELNRVISIILLFLLGFLFAATIVGGTVIYFKSKPKGFSEEGISLINPDEEVTTNPSYGSEAQTVTASEVVTPEIIVQEGSKHDSFRNPI